MVRSWWLWWLWWSWFGGVVVCALFVLLPWKQMGTTGVRGRGVLGGPCGSQGPPSLSILRLPSSARPPASGGEKGKGVMDGCGEGEREREGQEGPSLHCRKPEGRPLPSRAPPLFPLPSPKTDCGRRMQGGGGCEVGERVSVAKLSSSVWQRAPLPPPPKPTPTPSRRKIYTDLYKYNRSR